MHCGTILRPASTASLSAKAAVQESLKDTFRRLYGGTEGALTEAELAEAEERIRTKFGTQEWLHRVP